MNYVEVMVKYGVVYVPKTAYTEFTLTAPPHMAEIDMGGMIRCIIAPSLTLTNTDGITGAHDAVYGDAVDIEGDVSELVGDLSYISGRLTPKAWDLRDAIKRMEGIQGYWEIAIFPVDGVVKACVMHDDLISQPLGYSTLAEAVDDAVARLT